MLKLNYYEDEAKNQTVTADIVSVALAPYIKTVKIFYRFIRSVTHFCDQTLQ